MNFFKSQDIARKNTARLIMLFSLAVVSLIIMTNLLLMLTFGYLEPERFNSMTALQAMEEAFDWEMFLGISVLVIAIVGLGSLYKIISLTGGGARVAEMLGGELIVDGSGDINRQKMLNVVEEMAIASGTPVPPVYLLDEAGINAFAAGYTPGDAVIGVTRGAIEQLSREQLQGVVAHEFSHILNGDMRLNIRLIGILHGIMLLGIIGYYLLRGSSRSSRSKNAGGIVFLALGLMVIGYAGTFFGNLIKAAVSRQREYLADASAVQFTRNPDGIAGALRRIGGSTQGSLIENPNGSEISHALFSEGIKSLFGGLYATHPPLEKRIRAIDPRWDGEFDYSAVRQEQATDQPAPDDAAQAQDSSAAAMATVATVLAGDALLDRVGQPGPAQLNYAHAMLQQLPEALKSAIHEPYAARAVIYYLVLDNDAGIRSTQLDHLQSHADAGVYEALVNLVDQDSRISVEHRLPLLDIALSTLRQLSKKQYLLFRDNLDALIKTDNRINLFEWSLQKIVTRHLDPVFLHGRATAYGHVSTRQFRESCEILLSVLVYAGKQNGVDKNSVFEAGRSELDIEKLVLRDRKQLDLDALNRALDTLSRLKPLKKPRVLKACAACITADRQITPTETELFRAIADTIDCPMPPMVIDD